MTPLSIDLRKRIVAAYEAGEGSYQTLAEQFQVGINSVVRYVTRWRSTGDLRPKPHGGGPRRKIDVAGERIVRALVASQPDATLVELCGRFAAATGITVSDTTMSDTLIEIGLARKKSRRTRASSTVRTLSSHVHCSPTNSARSTRAT
jgi:transposase